MSAERAIVVKCDHPGCSATYRTEGASVYHSRRWAMLERWSCASAGQTDYCPAHNTAAKRRADLAEPALVDIDEVMA